MSREEHWDVASYALGVLDEADTERFEEHLATCWVCAGELESFLPVVDALGAVNGNDLAVTEQVDRDGRLLGRMLTAVGDDRRRARRQRVLSLAAGVVLIALVGALALFAGANWVAEPQVAAGPPPSSSAPKPDVGPGERHSATDAKSGVHAEVAVDTKPFGTRISFALSNLDGPATCRLVALTKDGAAEVLSSWQVPPGGYGTPARPDALTLQAATASPLKDLQAVEVQVLQPDGATSPLVTVPV
ncbi:Putative zinc-finger [Asanoa hainanensis]|uniref:Putative zinc-finger n=1 Tax=Asanoa hainanensis TaxID=560556 RepID=A0A239NJD9_9ACTN|nr:zf-HC2 domain-containing protein [Asanoa hainanensis]SNT55037.1 Putative zinc-finger [Asanoa hainanensis]